MDTQTLREMDSGIHSGVTSVLGFNHQEAPDSAQNAWLRIWRYMRSGREVANPFSFGWKAGVWAALNRLKEVKRSKRWHQLGALVSTKEDEEPEVESVAEFSDQGEGAREVEGTVSVNEIVLEVYAALTRRQIEIFNYILMGLKQKEIAVCLDLSPPAVCAEVALIRKALEALLFPDDGPRPSGPSRGVHRRDRKGTSAGAANKGMSNMKAKKGPKTLLDLEIPSSLVHKFVDLVLQLPAFAETTVQADGPEHLLDVVARLNETKSGARKRASMRIGHASEGGGEERLTKESTNRVEAVGSHILGGPPPQQQIPSLTCNGWALVTSDPCYACAVTTHSNRADLEDWILTLPWEVLLSKNRDWAVDCSAVGTALGEMLFRECFKATTTGAHPLKLKLGIELAVCAAAETGDKLAQLDAYNFTIFNADKAAVPFGIETMKPSVEAGAISARANQVHDRGRRAYEPSKLDRGYLSPFFANVKQSERVQVHDCFLLTDKKLSSKSVPCKTEALSVDCDIDKIWSCFAKLVGCVAVINRGAGLDKTVEAELIPGGRLALLHSISVVEEMQAAEVEVQMGANIVRRVVEELTCPVTACLSAGGSVLPGKYRSLDTTKEVGCSGSRLAAHNATAVNGSIHGGAAMSDEILRKDGKVPSGAFEIN